MNICRVYEWDDILDITHLWCWSWIFSSIYWVECFFYLALQSYDTCYSYHRKDMTHGLLLGWLWMITTQMAGMTTAQKAWIVHSQDVGRSIYSTFKFCWTIVSIFLSLTVCLSDMKSLNTIVNFLKETSDCVLILKICWFPHNLILFGTLIP